MTLGFLIFPGFLSPPGKIHVALHLQGWGIRSWPGTITAYMFMFCFGYLFRMLNTAPLRDCTLHEKCRALICLLNISGKIKLTLVKKDVIPKKIQNQEKGSYRKKRQFWGKVPP